MIIQGKDEHTTNPEHNYKTIKGYFRYLYNHQSLTKIGYNQRKNRYNNEQEKLRVSRGIKL